MNEERLLAVIAFTLMFVILGHAVYGEHKSRATFERIEQTLDLMEEDVEEQKAKNTVRDAWMLVHQSDIMEQIEKRIKEDEKRETK